ncbi:MAG: TMEM175 family protein [Chitinophagaceae bacterium]
MEQHLQAEKNKFQLDRIALFSDAIFAIAITLLIIEIKVPVLEGSEVNDHELWKALGHLLPEFIGFFISFLVIGVYWLTHHRLFKFIVRVNQKLLWGNLLFMLPIVVMPFSTAFFSEYYNSSLKLPLLIYAANILLAGLFIFRLWRMVYQPKNGLSEGLTKIIYKYNVTRALVIPGIFAFALLLSFISSGMAYIIPLLAPLIIYFINFYFSKRYPEDIKGYLE